MYGVFLFGSSLVGEVVLNDVRWGGMEWELELGCVRRVFGWGF